MGDPKKSKNQLPAQPQNPPAQNPEVAALGEVLKGFLEQLSVSNQMQQALMEQNRLLKEKLAAEAPRMTAGGNGRSGSNIKIMTELSQRIPKYAYDIRETDSFRRWIGRYDLVFTEDGSSLTERERTRLLLGSLEEATFQRFVDSQRDITDIYDITYEDTVKALTKVFGSQRSIMIRRQSCLQISRASGQFSDPLEYTNHIGESVINAKLSEMNADDWSVFLFLRGLDAPEDAQAKVYLMQYLESLEKKEGESVTLSQIHDQWIAFMQMKRQTKIVTTSQAKPDFCVRAVAPDAPEEEEPEEKEKDPKTKPPYCSFCKRSGHSLAKCWSRKSQEDEKWTQNVRVDGIQSDFCEKLTKSVAVNGKYLQFEIDTGSSITIINADSWKCIGSPKLEHVCHGISCANRTTLKVLGRVVVSFVINGTKFSDFVYVRPKGENLMGMSWLNHSPTMKSAMLEMINQNAAPTQRKANQLSVKSPEKIKPICRSQNAARSSTFQIGQPVFARVRKGTNSWTIGVVTRRFGLFYKVQCSDRRYRCHFNQMKPRYGDQWRQEHVDNTTNPSGVGGFTAHSNSPQESRASKGAAGRGKTNLSCQVPDSSFSSCPSPDNFCDVTMGTNSSSTPRSSSVARHRSYRVVDSHVSKGTTSNHRQTDFFTTGSSSPSNGKMSSSFLERGGEEKPTGRNQADGPLEGPCLRPTPDPSHSQRSIKSIRRAPILIDQCRETLSHSQDHAHRRGSKSPKDHATSRRRAISLSSCWMVPSQNRTQDASARGGGVG